MIYFPKPGLRSYEGGNYMRGKRGWLEKFSDIDGNVCHHIYNTVKQFCKPSECFVGKWIDNIHWDTKYSTDILDSLKEICFILTVPFRKPPQRVSHRWLSVLNCLSINMTLIDLLILLYYAWKPNDFRELSRPFSIIMSWIRKTRP